MCARRRAPPLRAHDRPPRRRSRPGAAARVKRGSGRRRPDREHAARPQRRARRAQGRRRRRAGRWRRGSARPGRCRHRAGSRRTRPRAARSIAATSPRRSSTRGSSRLPANSAAIGPRAQATTAGTSSATATCAPRPQRRQRRAQREAHAEPADQQRAARGPSAMPLAGQRRQRLLRAAEPAVHQLVAAEHDRKFVAAPLQPQLAAAGHRARCRSECAGIIAVSSRPAMTPASAAVDPDRSA